MADKRVLAFDFGASSGRAMLGEWKNGKIELREIHRFANDPVFVGDTLYWDILRLFHEIKQAIIIAVREGGFDSIGIDTWGVDFGLLDKKGQLISNPVNYRDLRTEGEDKLVEIPFSEIYSHSGIQFLRFNTIYQLHYLFREEKELMKLCDKILMIPDLFAYFLTGVKKCEYTNASTTGLLDPATKEWDISLCEKVGIDVSILPEMISAGDIYGKVRPELASELGCGEVPVIAVATHDTASAVVSVPEPEKDFVFISSGTWSLFGTENPTHVINSDTLAENFTNESGYGRTTRFLKNIMGLWLIQQSRAWWRRTEPELSFGDMEREALNSKAFGYFVDVDHPSFELPGNIPAAIEKYCEATMQGSPSTRGETVRCIYESLAMKYRVAFEKLQRLTGKKYECIHIVGGGIKDTLLCQLTADATGITVVAGPAEATAMGNVCVQLIALGEFEDLKDARKAVKESVEPKIYSPQDTDKWDLAFEKYKKITEGNTI
ncbi:MAG: rhamnulokinase [Clostridia bacterium]|nr:rhamnulokinase [Clostridia bacterium]MBQ6906518.1 rhamnulokinase [Clostridia bacterium]